MVIVESVGSSKGNVITSYGPNGARGNSGDTIFGGKPKEPGMVVTHDSIINGKYLHQVEKLCHQQYKFTHNAKLI